MAEETANVDENNQQNKKGLDASVRDERTSTSTPLAFFKELY